MRNGINVFAFAFIFSLCLSSCSKNDRKNIEDDYVFCYLSSSYVDDTMKNWGCYSDIVPYSGKTTYKQRGYRFEYNQEIHTETKQHLGRVFAFNSSSYILGGTYGIGYINKTGIVEIAIKTPIISRQDGKVLFLSINSNYSKIKDDTNWSYLPLDTATFVSLVFSSFSSANDGPYGYLAYKVLRDVFIDKLTDYTDEYARSITWNSGSKTVNFYDELNLMEKNYLSKKKDSTITDILLYILGGFLACSLVITIVLLFAIYMRKYGKRLF